MQTLHPDGSTTDPARDRIWNALRAVIEEQQTKHNRHGLLHKLALKVYLDADSSYSSREVAELLKALADEASEYSPQSRQSSVASSKNIALRKILEDGAHADLAAVFSEGPPRVSVWPIEVKEAIEARVAADMSRCSPDGLERVRQIVDLLLSV